MHPKKEKLIQRGILKNCMCLCVFMLIYVNVGTHMHGTCVGADNNLWCGLHFLPGLRQGLILVGHQYIHQVKYSPLSIPQVTVGTPASKSGFSWVLVSEDLNSCAIYCSLSYKNEILNNISGSMIHTIVCWLAVILLT